MTGGSKGSKNCVRVLENVNRKEKVIKSKSLEIDNLGRYTLRNMIRCRRWLRQIFRGQDTKGSCYRADTDVIKNYERKNGYILIEMIRRNIYMTGINCWHVLQRYWRFGAKRTLRSKQDTYPSIRPSGLQRKQSAHWTARFQSEPEGEVPNGKKQNVLQETHRAWEPEREKENGCAHVLERARERQTRTHTRAHMCAHTLRLAFPWH